MLRSSGKAYLIVSQAEWDLLKAMMDFLESMKTASKILSSESSPTINLALVLRSELKSKLEITSADTATIKSMKRSMTANFDHRFPATPLMITASLLDPRFTRLTEVEQYLQENNVTRVEFLSKQIRERVKKEDLPRQTYANEQRRCPETASTSSTADFLSSLATKHSAGAGLQDDEEIEAECAAYFSNISPQSVIGGDVLAFWDR